ncbi:Na+:solute symporter [candidate division KSB1 bacterium]|nr:Na+:solute symporter [candidate division KSB1 bacterium]
MQLIWIDWIIIAAYFIISLLIGLYYSRRAGKSMGDFFLSGRNLPWWLAGTSMVATTFAADTPLAVTGLVADNGIAGNWLWWNFAIGGMLTVFFYARLWKRTGILTDIEFTELRYSGRPAAILRGFRALYLSLPINCIILGWVILAMKKILQIALGVDAITAIGICLGVTLLYSASAGLMGSVRNDFIQFCIAMGGCIALAIFAVDKVGGMSGLMARLNEQFGADHAILNFLPQIGSPWMPISAFLVYIGLQWWAAWYPGAEPGGGGYVAQRMFSCRTERDSLLATLWFNVAHYALRPWPWIIVAMVSMAMFPHAADKEAGFVQVMMAVLPNGFIGLLLAAFAAAFMSTVASQINWGTSYFVNDFYRRFVKKRATERHYVLVSRLATVMMMIIAVIVTLFLDTISGAWKFLLTIGAGTGGVYLLRWFWWRVNAWSEISAMITALIVAATMQFGFGFSADNPKEFALLMLTTTIITTLIWILVTLLTRPVAEKTLIDFYRRTHPGGLGWKNIRSQCPDVKADTGLVFDFIDWIAGFSLIYLALFGIGKIILGGTLPGIIMCCIALLLGLYINHDLKKRSWKV